MKIIFSLLVCITYSLLSFLFSLQLAAQQSNGVKQEENKVNRSKQGQQQTDRKSRDGGESATDDTEKITLERLFPKESFFGPSAREMSFSHDGRYAAFLYRPYLERRHGDDLWIYDFELSELKRVTHVGVMSEFQSSARKVKDDRIAKHEKKQKEEQKKQDSLGLDQENKGVNDDNKTEQKNDASTTGDQSQQQEKQSQADTSNSNQQTSRQQRRREARQRQRQEEEAQRKREQEIVTQVDTKDADDKQAPRYSGISGFRWHPLENNMLIFSEGDVYQLLDLEKIELKRLTKTTANETQVAYLPDGTGYSYNKDNVVYRVKFGDHFIEQLNPQLPADVTLVRYELSPDGKKLAIQGRKGGGTAGRRVDFIRYRDRFAKADSVSRTVSDDEVQPQDTYVYLYDLENSLTEEAELIQVFHNKIENPRDIISSPQWSPDSQRITFCFYDQSTDEVQILMAGFPDEKRLVEIRAEASKLKRDEGAANATKVPPQLTMDSRVVYRFTHFGGPNTPRMVSPQWAWDSRQIVFVSEQSGFRHLHLLDTVYESVRQLTSGHFEVYPQQLSEDHRTYFVSATKEMPSRELVYRVDLESGEMTRLSQQDGNYTAFAINQQGNRLIANFQTYGQLSELIAQSEKEQVTPLTDSHPEEAKKLTTWQPEFFTYTNRHGQTIHGKMFKPKNWSKQQKHPLLIYVYGGPLGTRKSVVDGSYSSDGYFFQGYMAHQHDYITVVIDPRGQSGYGGLFEKSNYEQVGKPQVEDLVDGVNFLKQEYNIDEQRVGIFGWSFGGFQTQMCLYTEPEVFQVGIAGAGPTEWENYNSWYTTGTVGPSAKGKPDQKKYSLRPLAKNLQGKLLLVHGVEDTNVLFQDTIAVYRELLQADKETLVELFIDPTGGHGLEGDVKRINRMRKYEEFLLRTLGTGKSTKKKDTSG